MATVQSITQRIQDALRDSSGDTWPAETIHGAIYEAECMIVNIRPDETARDVEMPLQVGAKQSIAALTPAPNAFLTAKYNRVNDVDGRAVRRIAMSDQDAISPNWRSAAPSSTIREFMIDDREKLIFFVNPPAAIGAKLQLSYSAIPAEYGVVGGSTTTTVGDSYIPMIIEWALYRLFGHDVEGSVNISRSQGHLSAFQRMMGVKVEAERTMSAKNPEHKR